MLTPDERAELEELRRYKQLNDTKALTRAFVRLEQLMECAQDPSISLRAFRAVAECLVALRDRIEEK